MNLRMAVRAAAIEHENRSHSPRRTGMPRRNVTLRTKPRVGKFEQSIVDRAVRVVTVRAVLQNRRMLPQERTAPLGMTGVAVFVHAGLPELRGVRGTMRIMTIRARHLSLAYRHMR